MGNPKLPQVRVRISGFVEAADVVNLLPKMQHVKSWDAQHGLVDLILTDEDTKSVLEFLANPDGKTTNKKSSRS